MSLNNKEKHFLINFEILFHILNVFCDIDKTIKYFERIARANKSANLDERAKEYTQIAEWLKELKELKNNNGKEK